MFGTFQVADLYAEYRFDDWEQEIGMCRTLFLSDSWVERIGH